MSATWKKFYVKVRKKTNQAAIVATGDAVDLVLLNGAVKTVTLTNVTEVGRTIWWDKDAVVSGVKNPTAEEVRAVDGNHQPLPVEDDDLHDGNGDDLIDPPVGY